MLTIPSTSESVAVYAGDFSSTQLLDLTHDSYCNLYGLTVVWDDAVQFNNLRLDDESHQDAGAETLLLAAAGAQSELRLLVQSVEGMEVRLIERQAFPAAIEYGDFIFAIDSYAMLVATSNVESLACYFDGSNAPATPWRAAPSQAAPPPTTPAPTTPAPTTPLYWAEPMPALLPGDYRFAAVYALEPPHSVRPKPMGLADLVRGPANAAICGAPDDP